MADPFSALAGLGSSIIGTKQLGGIAPAFNQGGGAGGFLGGPSLGLDFGQGIDPGLLDALSKQARKSQGGVDEALQATPEQPVPLPNPGNPLGISDNVNALPGVNQDLLGQLGTPGIGDEVGGGNPFSNFFGNLDQNLQSPSKVLGLGLLNQIDPRLAGAGLLAGGLFRGR